MNFQDFYNQNNNHFVEVVDPNSLNQCFDLSVKWCMENGFSNTVFSGLTQAWQIYERPNDFMVSKFDFIPNSPSGVPKQGDIVVWGKEYNGGAGHTGIATGTGDINSFHCFVQNDPIGHVSYDRVYNYYAIHGWIRFKTPVTNDWQTKLQAFKSVWYKPEDVIADYKARQAEITTKDGVISNYKARLDNIKITSTV